MAQENEIVAVLNLSRSDGAFKKITRHGDAVFFEPKIRSGFYMEYLCVPDTIDPRAPKRSGR
jgi:hypothetical protein